MTSALLASHLEQISLCAASISELHFQEPKAFTNAVLAPHDITLLIRDTEVHERALFSLAAPPVPAKGQPLASSISKPPQRNTAVAAVLGNDLYKRVRNAGSDSSANVLYGKPKPRERGDLDVEVLLEGAEKLLGVYPMAGATERISKMRQRHQQLADNIAHYEDRVARIAAQLDTVYQRKGYEDLPEDEELPEIATPVRAPVMSQEDLQMEEREIRDLERKKKGLEERVTGMEKDLGGLMR